MEKLFSRRQIWIGLLSLLILWSAIFLFVTYFTPQTPVLISGDNLRKRLWTLTTHKSIQWKNVLQSRSYKQHILKSSRSFSFPQWVVMTWIQERIPASSWTLFIEWTTNYNKTYWSWTYFFTLQANIFSWWNNPLSWNVIDTVPAGIIFSWSVHVIRSGQALRWQLNNLSLSQQSWMNNFILISRAYLKQYENTWLHYNNIEQSRIDFIQSNIYDRLALQSKQHIIPSSWWTIKLIIEGEQNSIDMTISSGSMLNGNISFNNNKNTLSIEEDLDSNKLLTTLYWNNKKDKRWAWYIWLDVSNTKLVLTSNRAWNLKEAFFYSGTHSSSFASTEPFEYILPEQRREWWKQ
jgi:hypothetical protein